MIFQHFNLLSSRSVFDNVALPLELAGVSKDGIKAKVEPLLELAAVNAALWHAEDDLRAHRTATTDPRMLTIGEAQRT